MWQWLVIIDVAMIIDYWLLIIDYILIIYDYLWLLMIDYD